MQSYAKFWIGFLLCAVLCVSGSIPTASAGVDQSIQDHYKRNYENRAMFLKIPLYAQKQVVNIGGRTFQAESGMGAPLHKVGDQFRITEVDFRKDEIRFRLIGINSPDEAEIIFSFPVELQENFPGREMFDRVLQSTFTEGLSYTDIDQAKLDFIKGEFDRSVDRMVDATAIDSNTVLEKVAPLIPDYSKMVRARDELAAKVQDVTAQLNKIKTDNLELEARLKERNDEIVRIQNANASIRENLGSSKSQVEKLQAELRNTKEKAQSYQRQIESIQQSLNVESDSNRDLTRNNAELADRITALQNDLKGLQEDNARLSDDIEDYKSEIGKMKSTISTLTSNKNSIGRQYVELKDEKEKLDEYIMAVNALYARIEEEEVSKGIYSGKAGIYANDVRLGFLTWKIPSYLNHNESKSCQATFTSESIDYVKIEPDERQLLRTLGERLKIRLALDSLSPTMKVSTEEDAALHELGERESFTWNWLLQNSGTQDVHFILSAHLVNKNSQDISLFQRERVITASNPIRLIRSYLEPVPLVTGVVLGFLLFGIVGIFRKPKSRKRTPPPGPDTNSKPYIGAKKL